MTEENIYLQYYTIFRITTLKDVGMIKTYGSKYPVVAYVDDITLKKLEETRGKVPRAAYLEDMIKEKLGLKGDVENENNCS